MTHRCDAHGVRYPDRLASNTTQQHKYQRYKAEQSRAGEGRAGPGIRGSYGLGKKGRTGDALKSPLEPKKFPCGGDKGTFRPRSQGET